METILFSIDSKEKVRYLKVGYELLDDGNYKIYRSSGLLDGKDVTQPPLLVKVGKAKRTKEEQVELEFNSLINKAKDKGYKTLESLGVAKDDVSQETIAKALGTNKTDTSGIKKPMLAKDTLNAKPAIWNRYWFISKKLDGKMDAVFKFR